MEGITELLNHPVAFWRELDRIERRYDEKKGIQWFHDYWWLSFVFSGIYLALIYIGTEVMKNRKPFDLRRALCMWSTALAVFSAYACIKIFPMMWNLIKFGGFEYSVCDTTYLVGSTGMGIWGFLFPFSKLPELFDTLFIVLRKTKLSFLHYYHHFSVFIYCWYSYAFPISTGVWFGTVNFFVHAIMYSYYAIRASGRYPPRWVARAITTLQLSQMFFGMFLNYTAFKAFFTGKTCAMDRFTVAISIFFYVTYAILFANFYYRTYIRKKPSTGKPNETARKDVASNGITPSANGVIKPMCNGSTTGLKLTKTAH